MLRFKKCNSCRSNSATIKKGFKFWCTSSHVGTPESEPADKVAFQAAYSWAPHYSGLPSQKTSKGSSPCHWIIWPYKGVVYHMLTRILVRRHPGYKALYFKTCRAEMVFQTSLRLPSRGKSCTIENWSHTSYSWLSYVEGGSPGWFIFPIAYN